MTVAEIAEELKVTKQAIHQRIKKEPLSTSLHQFTSIKGKSLTIHVDGVNIIRKAFESKMNVNRKAKVDVNVNQQNVDDSLRFMIETLTKQLEEKDKQINEKDKQISNLDKRLEESQKLNVNQQELLRREQEKMLSLQAPKESIFQKLKSKRTNVK